MKTLEQLIAHQPFWDGLSPEYFPLIADCANMEHFRPGEEIFKRGYDAAYFYLILSGKVALETPYLPGEGVITVQTIGPNEPLGWSWFFPPYQWHFTARATEPTEAIGINAASLRRKARENPAFGYDLALRVGAVLLERLQKTRMRLLDVCEVIQ